MTSEAWRPGQVIDIDTEDGMEFGAEILGPSKDGDAKEMQIKFRDAPKPNIDIQYYDI